MDNEITLKKDEYQEMLKKVSQFDVISSEITSLKNTLTELKTESQKVKEENDKLKEEHEKLEKSKKENLKKEADDYISKKINDGFIKPAFKDRYVDEYVQYKADDGKFKSLIEDIESRGKVIDLSATKNKTGNVEVFKYNPEEVEPLHPGHSEEVVDPTSQFASIRMPRVQTLFWTSPSRLRLIPGRPIQTSGQSTAPIIVAASPAMPIRVSCGVIVLRPSVSVMPLILQITQKPLSFIHGSGLEPQPMARAR